MEKTALNNTPRKRIAAIDLGTNSFHAIIVDIYPDGSFRRVDKLKEMVELGRSSMDKGLPDDAMDRGINALRKIKTLCEHQDTEKILAYATSAIREAPNGGDFIQRMIDELQLKALAIPGRMEAELIGHAIQHAISLDEHPVLMVDIGGGSVEFVVGNNDEFYYRGSKKMGVARMLNRFVRSDPISNDEISSLKNYYSSQLNDVARTLEDHQPQTIIGSSGTLENVAGIIAGRKGVRTSMTLNEFSYSAEEFFEMYDDIITMDRKERLNIKELDRKRIDNIVPGLVLMEYLIRRFNIDTIRTSEEALREGMILKYIKEEMDDLRQMAEYPDPRRRSVFENLHKYHWHEDHSTKVTNLALHLFDALQDMLELDDDNRELLEYAGLLHDIGYFISHRKHHKHALYLIRHADLRGFKEEEIEIIANVARYHRRSTPKKRHKYYRRLRKDIKKRIRKLAGIIRVADGLDRSHYQNVQHMDIEIDDDTIRLMIQTESDPELEIWGAKRKSQLLEKVTGRKLEIEAVEVMEDV